MLYVDCRFSFSFIFFLNTSFSFPFLEALLTFKVSTNAGVKNQKTPRYLVFSGNFLNSCLKKKPGQPKASLKLRVVLGRVNCFPFTVISQVCLGVWPKKKRYPKLILPYFTWTESVVGGLEMCFCSLSLFLRNEWK